MNHKITFSKIFLIAIILVGFTSCAKKISFQNSAVEPAAIGSVKIKKDDNKNYAIKIFIRNLAGTSKLSPPKAAYIVWLETDNQPAKNIGQIKSGTNTFSNKLKASFETISVTKPTKVFITAEDDASIQYPGNFIILTTNNF